MERLLIAALYHGVAVAARDLLVGYLNERTPSNLGALRATLPRFQRSRISTPQEDTIRTVADRTALGRWPVCPPPSGQRDRRPDDRLVIRTTRPR